MFASTDRLRLFTLRPFSTDTAAPRVSRIASEPPLPSSRARGLAPRNLDPARAPPAAPHRFAGQSSLAAAAVLILPWLLGVRLPLPVVVGLVLAWVALLCWYSYVQWRDDPARG